MDETIFGQALTDLRGAAAGLRGAAEAGRLIVVSNRVAPIEEGQPTAGGLAAGVLDALQDKGGLWIGWSGDIAANGQSLIQPERQKGRIRLQMLDLAQSDYEEYYRGFANSALWPVLHYRASLARFSRSHYAGYKRVNDLFAQAVAEGLAGEDIVWAHDYHLLGLAAALRARGVQNRLGIFLHTPFPTAPVFMTLPVHGELARALCQYDLIGFQTEADRRAFEDYVLREADGHLLPGRALMAFGRVVRTGVYPIGVQTEEIRAQASPALACPQVAKLHASIGETKLIISVDRLDYSKGLAERFLAYERFLEQNESRRGSVTFLQIAPPSRSDVETYREIRLELEGEAGRINGRFAELDWTPLRYLNKGFARQSLMPMYALADVGLVTPMRDGMNLVAKEYVAAQDPIDPGVLVLSQFAGAACELKAALLVNPHDPDEIAEALEQALSMPLAERRERHGEMMAMLRRNSLGVWRDRFLGDLNRRA
ncbi:alpha,alpha-trehalose-phosphate synthase (UDP-forming) [Acidisoma sp. C75]